MGKQLQTVAAMACMKSLLMVFNIVFWVSGIAILAIGIWMEVELYKYMEMSTEFSGTAPYVLIGTGSLIILIGSFACCCTVKGQPVLLYVYGAFLAIIFVLEFGAGISIFAYRSKLTDGFDKGLTQAMMNYRNDSAHLAEDFDLMQETLLPPSRARIGQTTLESSCQRTITPEAQQQEVLLGAQTLGKLQCCGNEKPTDWLNLTPAQPIPASCCIKENCDTGITDQIYSQGCYTKIVDFLNANIGMVAGAALGIAFFPLVGVILSCCLASIINKTKYEQMA